METSLNSIQINGVEYVRKDSIQTNQLCENYFIVRTYSAGVFAGEIVKRDGQEVFMKNARRLWRWSGASSLSQMAVDGTSNPNGCKFPCEVPEVTLLQVIEILPCTPVAQKSIKEVPVWKS